MEDRTARLESAVEALRLAVLALEQRLQAIEAQGRVGAAAESLAPDAACRDATPQSARAKAKDPYDPIAMLSRVGRLLLVLAGGFLLRALTEAGLLAVPVGIALAFAYAAVWLAMSERAGRRAQVPDAAFHALAAALVAYPLTVEATTRFMVLNAPASAAAVAAVSAGLLFVAWRRRLRAAAWIAVAGALPAIGALIVKTGSVAPFAGVLVALGAATLWMAYQCGWWGSRWPAALAADIAVAGVTLRAMATPARDSPQLALALLLLLLLAYLGSTAWRTLLRGRDASRFEIVQTGAALLVALGGALLVTRGADSSGSVATALGAATAIVGASCYGAAVLLVERRGGSAINFHFYTSLALVLVLAGASIAIVGPWLGALFGWLGALCAGLWSRHARAFLLPHAALYVVAAGLASGAFAYGMRTLVAGADGPWAPPDAAILVVLVATALCAALAARRTLAAGDELAIGARLVVAVVLAWTAPALLVGPLAPLLAGPSAQGLDAGALATLRTGVLSLATLAVAWIGRHARWREWGWLVYPLLVGIGLKLVSEDFRHSRPATLFIALALYGAALILAPRLRRSGDKGTSD